LPLAYGYLSTAIAFLFERALDVAADLTTSKITEEGIEITENTEIERVREIKRGRALNEAHVVNPVYHMCRI